MPSVLLTAASGAPFPLYSGALPFSGQAANCPYSFVALKLDNTASGRAYVWTTSGGPYTTTSGRTFLESSGQLGDGMMLWPGDRYNIPKLDMISGQLNIFATCDAAASGQGRLWWDVQ